MKIKQYSNKKEEAVKKKKPPPLALVVNKKEDDKTTLKIVKKGSQPMLLKSCGNIYNMSNPYGSLVSAPMTKKEINTLLTGDLDPKKLPSPQAVLVRTPAAALRPPIEFVKLLGQQLLAYDTEALCVYGVNRKDPTDWLGVVPEQEVTSASVEVDDFSTAIATLSSKGYKVIGTIHTHPGGMTSCSSTDTGELWNEFAGIHLIITHTGILSYYFSTRGYTWDLKGYEGFKHVVLWPKNRIPDALKSCDKLYAQDGTLNYPEFIFAKTYVTATNKGFGFGYEDYGDLYDDVYPYAKKSKKTKSNLTYENTTYYGKWDPLTKEVEHVVQKRYTKVNITYCDKHGGYFDSLTGGYYAGDKPKTTRPADKKRYRTLDKKPPTTEFQIVNKKKAKEIEKKKIPTTTKIITSDSLDLIVDSLETALKTRGSDGALAFVDDLDIALDGVSTALLSIEDLITEALTDTVDHSADMRATIIRLLLILPLFEKLVWGKKAREDNHYAGIIPDSWKGRK